MEILKGMVKDAGFPDEECTYVKLDDTTLYYFIKDYSLSNGNIIATTNLKEAIGHATYTSLGVINQEGKVLIPFENKTIKPIKDNLLLVEKNVPTTESVVNAFNNKSDPFAAQGFAESAATIKKQMKDIMGFNGEFIFDNQFSECALYTMDGVNVANNYFSFIGESNGDYYLATNVVGATIMKFNPSQLVQPDISAEQTTNEPQEEVTQTEIASQQEMPMQEQSTTVEGGTNNSFTPNIDISNQNTIEQEKPPIVNTETDMNEMPEPSETTDSIKEEETAIPEEEIKLNIGEETQELKSENGNRDEELGEQSEIETSEEDSIEDNVEETSFVNTSEESNNEETTESFVDEENTSLIDGTSVEDEEEITEPENSIDEENTSEYDNSDEEQETVENQETKPYNLTDEDIATPTIKDATNTIKRLLEENRKQRQIIDKQTGEIEALKTNVDILREENFSQEQEVQSLRQEMTDYRTKANNLIRENTKIMGTLARQNDIMKNLEEQNTTLRDQVAGMHALSNAVAEANVLVQPVESEASIPTSSYPNSNLDIDSYLNGNYGNNNNRQEITYGDFNYLDEQDNGQTQDMNENDSSFQKRMAA